MKKKSWIYIIIAILLVGGISYLIAKPSSPNEYDAFAKCLTEQGAKMYGTDWCSYCQKQKKMFGKSFKYAPYVNCDTNQLECNSADVKGYPTWIVNGESYSGVQQLEYLSSLTGCSLEETEVCTTEKESCPLN